MKPTNWKPGSAWKPKCNWTTNSTWETNSTGNSSQPGENHQLKTSSTLRNWRNWKSWRQLKTNQLKLQRNPESPHFLSWEGTLSLHLQVWNLSICTAQDYLHHETTLGTKEKSKFYLQKGKICKWGWSRLWQSQGSLQKQQPAQDRVIE